MKGEPLPLPQGVMRGEGLVDDTKLYRYIGLSSFVSFVETYTTCLTKIQEWEDTWEFPIRRLAIPSLNKKIETLIPVYESTYGQCWSLNGESDALWRIYSRNREGLMIQTTVARFDLIRGIDFGVLAPVVYYDDLGRAIKNSKAETGIVPVFQTLACLKRRAFEHEHEVRLVTMNHERCLGQKYPDSPHISFALNPLEFIERIIIDPRANDWYVTTLQNYCERAGFTTVPTKSDLYST